MVVVLRLTLDCPLGWSTINLFALDSITGAPLLASTTVACVDTDSLEGKGREKKRGGRDRSSGIIAPHMWMVATLDGIEIPLASEAAI